MIRAFRSHLKHASLTLALTLFSCLVMSGCDQGSQAPTGPSSAGGGNGAILVGEFGSLTGAQATFGQSTHKGIQMALDEINAAGGVNGRKIELKTYDDQGKAQEAGTAVTRLITNDKVVAVLGEVASTLSLAGAPVAQTSGVPMISPSSTNQKVTQIGDMIFRVCFIDPFQGYVGAKFSRENLKAKSVGILYDQSQAYSVGLKDNFVKAWKAMGGGEMTMASYKGGDQDFNAQLAELRSKSPDVIYVPGYYTDVANIAIQARKLGITVPLVGGDGWESEKLTEIAGESIEGCYYSNHYANDNATPEGEAFVAKYKAANKNEEPDAMAALGYDAAKLLADAMGRAKSLGGKDLAAAIAATKDFKGVTRVITINAERNADKSAVVVQIKNGKPVFVASVEPPKS
jgi:branched-chain amino acid transport system substrate-binding protein